jgi:hypothetical protein
VVACWHFFFATSQPIVLKCCGVLVAPLKASSSLEAVKFSELLSVIVMTYPYINDPKYWRERGEEARSIAKLLDDQEAKRQMLAIAASYDRLSDHMKQRPRKLRK